MNGVLIIDKPAGLTSHDVVNRVRRILGQRSIGHLGTLDPMATGVLPLVTGSFTRLAQFYTRAEKTYEGTIRFGFSTDTYDAEGDPTSAPQSVSLMQEELERPRRTFRGVIEQTPASVLRQENSRRACLQTGAQTERSCSQARASGNQGIRDSRRSRPIAPVSAPASPPEPICARSPTTWASSSAAEPISNPSAAQP